MRHKKKKKGEMIIVKLIAKDSNYPNLQMNSTGLIIGRNQETKIKETRCAKEQGVCVYLR